MLVKPMNRRGFLKTTLGLSTGLFSAQLAMPFSVKYKMISPATDFIAREFFNEKLKAKTNHLKGSEPHIKIGETHCHSSYSDGTASAK